VTYNALCNPTYNIGFPICVTLVVESSFLATEDRRI